MQSVTRLMVNLGYDEFVSGGAAWADHSAVSVSNECDVGLHLCLPCDFDLELMQFEDNGGPSWRTNPGKTANHYHHHFSDTVYGDHTATLRVLGTSLLGDATYEVGKGFHARNKLVEARAVACVAMTMSDLREPMDGGTKHTWGLFRTWPTKPTLHVPMKLLGDLVSEKDDTNLGVVSAAMYELQAPPEAVAL